MSEPTESKNKMSALSIYLNDHLGLITGEIELARRAAGENEETPLADFLSGYADEVTQQRDAVKNILADTGKSPSSLKQAVGWLAEKIGRLKPNDALTGYTDLARVLELEALISAAESRRLMWEALEKVGRFPEETTAWKEQSLQQIAALHNHHERAVRLAFENRSTGPT